VTTPQSSTATLESATGAFRQLELGRRGEELAAAYLLRAGSRLVAANFSVPVGRNRRGAVINVEIDLVAYDGTTLCFVEVKSRASDWFAPPEANVDRRKQRQIARAARAYRRMFDLVGEPYRYDVVTVILPAAEETRGDWDIQLLRNYWTEDTLKKRTWSETYYE
jgi:putative endonuclease